MLEKYPFPAASARGNGQRMTRSLFETQHPQYQGEGGVSVCVGVGGGFTSNDFAAIKEERGVFCALIMVEKLAV